jgi:hypothetical protein
LKHWFKHGRNENDSVWDDVKESCCKIEILVSQSSEIQLKSDLRGDGKYKGEWKDGKPNGVGIWQDNKGVFKYWG